MYKYTQSVSKWRPIVCRCHRLRKNDVQSRRCLASHPKITTHYSVVPRSGDQRWKDIPMERVVDETD
ncbi:unnamed protein product, partial [Medioppia subpectinata]